MEQGQVFDGRYEIVRRLGTGGMAEVYLARDRNLDREVALKILLRRYADDPQFIERFRREASHAAALNHPNVVQIYDWGESEGVYYIAMEYVPGRTLKDLIVRYAPLRTDHIVAIAMQIVEAVRYAHTKGIVHRDIKPQNIIVDDEGRVKVTDFGIARAGNAARMTETGSILGTAQYLSPEQAQGAAVGPTSDLYSTGVVLYEMATGRVPFTGDNPVAIAMQHVNDPPARPSKLNPALPTNLERVILRALAKSPADRYESADLLLADLRRVERGQEVAAPASTDEGATSLMGGAAAAVGTAAAVGRPPGGVPLDHTQVRGTAQPATQPSASYPPPMEPGPVPQRRRRVWPWLLLVLLFLALLAAGAWAVLAGPLSTTAETQLVVVPGVVGLDRAAAEAKVTGQGLKFAVAGEEPSTQYQPGQVTRQEPPDGSKLEPDGEVRVWLAAGEQQVQVPDVVGKTRQEASSLLTGAEFQPEFKTEASADVAKDLVIRQDPAANAQAAKGSVISLWVSTGPPAPAKVAVPDVVGKTKAQAKTALEDAGLVAGFQTVASDRPAGEVVDQSPSAGRQANEGSVVMCSVSRGPQATKVIVPDVTGRSAKQAEAALRGAGLKAERVDQPEGSVAPGTVFDQDPPGGREVDRGSTVKIIVATPLPSTTSTAPPTTTTTTPTTSPPAS